MSVCLEAMTLSRAGVPTSSPSTQAGLPVAEQEQKSKTSAVIMTSKSKTRNKFHWKAGHEWNFPLTSSQPHRPTSDPQGSLQRRNHVSEDRLTSSPRCAQTWFWRHSAKGMIDRLAGSLAHYPQVSLRQSFSNMKQTSLTTPVPTSLPHRHSSQWAGAFQF